MINVFVLVIFIVLFGKSLSKCMSELRRGENLDTPLFLLVVALMSEVNQILLDSIHLFVYSLDGYGIFLCDALSNIFSMISQFLITFLILLVAHGWTITYDKIT